MRNIKKFVFVLGIVFCILNFSFKSKASTPSKTEPAPLEEEFSNLEELENTSFLYEEPFLTFYDEFQNELANFNLDNVICYNLLNDNEEILAKVIEEPDNSFKLLITTLNYDFSQSDSNLSYILIGDDLTYSFTNLNDEIYDKMCSIEVSIDKSNTYFSSYYEYLEPATIYNNENVIEPTNANQNILTDNSMIADKLYTYRPDYDIISYISLPHANVSDDDIIEFIPKEYFHNTGVFYSIGSSYGFVINTKRIPLTQTGNHYEKFTPYSSNVFVFLVKDQGFNYSFYDGNRNYNPSSGNLVFDKYKNIQFIPVINYNYTTFIKGNNSLSSWNELGFDSNLDVLVTSTNKSVMYCNDLMCEYDFKCNENDQTLETVRYDFYEGESVTEINLNDGIRSVLGTLVNTALNLSTNNTFSTIKGIYDTSKTLYDIYSTTKDIIKYANSNYDTYDLYNFDYSNPISLNNSMTGTKSTSVKGLFDTDNSNVDFQKLRINNKSYCHQFKFSLSLDKDIERHEPSVFGVDVLIPIYLNAKIFTLSYDSVTYISPTNENFSENSSDYKTLSELNNTEVTEYYYIPQKNEKIWITLKNVSNKKISLYVLNNKNEIIARISESKGDQSLLVDSKESEEINIVTGYTDGDYGQYDLYIGPMTQSIYDHRINSMNNTRRFESFKNSKQYIEYTPNADGIKIVALTLAYLDTTNYNMVIYDCEFNFIARGEDVTYADESDIECYDLNASAYFKSDKTYYILIEDISGEGTFYVTI